MGEKDAVTKTVQSHDPVFADIVNGLLFDGEILDEPRIFVPISSNVTPVGNVA